MAELEEYLSSKEFREAVKEDNKKTNKGTFNSSDLALIMNSCREAGVSKFTFGDLVIEFQGVSSERKLEPQADPQASQPSIEEPLITPVDLAAMEELERSNLLIENPSSFEDQMIKEDLEEIRVLRLEDSDDSRS